MSRDRLDTLSAELSHWRSVADVADAARDRGLASHARRKLSEIQDEIDTEMEERRRLAALGPNQKEPDARDRRGVVRTFERLKLAHARMRLAVERRLATRDIARLWACDRAVDLWAARLAEELAALVELVEGAACE